MTNFYFAQTTFSTNEFKVSFQWKNRYNYHDKKSGYYRGECLLSNYKGIFKFAEHNLFYSGNIIVFVTVKV